MIKPIVGDNRRKSIPRSNMMKMTSPEETLKQPCFKIWLSLFPESMKPWALLKFWSMIIQSDRADLVGKSKLCNSLASSLIRHLLAIRFACSNSHPSWRRHWVESSVWNLSSLDSSNKYAHSKDRKLTCLVFKHGWRRCRCRRYRKQTRRNSESRPRSQQTIHRSRNHSSTSSSHDVGSHYICVRLLSWVFVSLRNRKTHPRFGQVQHRYWEHHRQSDPLSKG